MGADAAIHPSVPALSRYNMEADRFECQILPGLLVRKTFPVHLVGFGNRVVPHHFFIQNGCDLGSDTRLIMFTGGGATPRDQRNRNNASQCSDHDVFSNSAEDARLFHSGTPAFGAPDWWNGSLVRGCRASPNRRPDPRLRPRPGSRRSGRFSGGVASLNPRLQAGNPPGSRSGVHAPNLYPFLLS